VRAVSTTTVERSAPVDVSNAQKISDRKETFLKATSRSEVKRTNVDAEALGGLGVKDRLGNWGQVVGEQKSAQAAVEERLAEAKGAAPVKDRLGNWMKSDSSDSPHQELVQERLAEVAGAPGVKDRLGVWGTNNSGSASQEKVQERLAEAAGAPGVKDRLGVWGKVVSEDKSDPEKVHERLAEVKGAAAVRERRADFLTQAQSPSSTERKQPIELPTEEPVFDKH